MSFTNTRFGGGSVSAQSITQFLPMAYPVTVTVNGMTEIVLPNTPFPNSVHIVRNHGVYERYGIDFTVSGNTVTWLEPDGNELETDDQITIYYRVQQ